MRKIPDPRLHSNLFRVSANRTFGKTQSGPLPFASAPVESPRRTFARSMSGPFTEPIRTSVPISLNLSNNELTTSSISNALFELGNLRFLSLRQNHLDYLPEGIGRLQGLVELSVAGNQLKFLPAEILDLTNLERVTVRPNPLLSPPINDRIATDSRVLGPLVVHFRVPSLHETCVRYLLANDQESLSQQPRILDYELPSFFTDDMLAPFRSVLFPFSTSGHQRRRRATSSDGSLKCGLGQHEQGTREYDSRHHICRSPAHAGQEKVFYRPAVERIEWVSEKALTSTGRSGDGPSGPRTIPIRHRGCSANCLQWLETA